MSSRIRLTVSRRTECSLRTLAEATGYGELFLAALALERGVVALVKVVSDLAGPLDAAQGTEHSPAAVMSAIVEVHNRDMEA